MEKALNKAIALGDYTLAEEFSDNISKESEKSRLEKIEQEEIQKKQIEEEEKKIKKKKTLHWGYLIALLDNDSL